LDVQASTPEFSLNGHSDRAHGPLTELVIPSDTAEARRVQEDIERLLAGCHFGERELFGIKLALEEALVNAIKHGNQMDSSKKVQISYQVHPDKFEIRITDEGSGFDPYDVPDPTDIENMDRPCGRGLMLMKHYMTDVQYNSRGNSVHMRKVVRK